MIKYIVQPGDNVANIASKFNISMQDIVRLNNINNPEYINPGKKLLIPIYSMPCYPYPIQIRPCTYWQLANSLFVCISTDKTLFKAGDTVKITLLETNMGNHCIKLNYNTSQKYDFLIRHISGEPIWKWSEDKYFTQTTEKIIIKPDSSIRYCETFNIPDDIQKGIYTITGLDISKQLNNFKLITLIIII